MRLNPKMSVEGFGAYPFFPRLALCWLLYPNLSRPVKILQNSIVQRKNIDGRCLWQAITYYTCMESAFRISAGKRWAKSMAIHDFLDAVALTMTTTFGFCLALGDLDEWSSIVIDNCCAICNAYWKTLFKSPLQILFFYTHLLPCKSILIQFDGVWRNEERHGRWESKSQEQASDDAEGFDGSCPCPSPCS